MDGCSGVLDPHVDGYGEGKCGVKLDGAAGSRDVGGCALHERNLSGCLLEGGAGHAVEPVAIIGMAMRLPGGIRDSESFWDLLINKKSGRCRVPKDRYNIDTWYGPGKIGHVGSEYGYFLEDVDLAQLDGSFWSVAKQDAEVMDPQQRLILEVVYECLENAGAKDWRGKNIGCYMGTFADDWSELDVKDSQNMHTYRLTGYADYMPANRVSYEFGFTGPSLTTRTACSSSLTGLHEACQALYSGECTSAVVGGTNIIISPHLVVMMTEQGVLSPAGCCKSFDADADGYARGEAVSAIYIKKLRDAIRDGDPVRAVIRSTCIGSDGKTPSLTMPNARSHEALIRRGHHIAGIYDFSKTAMMECHGTGTRVGDPIETAAVASVFGEHGIYIGSVKPNIGHSEGASGISSIIKMVLALEKKTIPPNINFKKPNPLIPFEKAKLKVPTDAMPWPADRMERVGVNSFGIGGSNAHVLLESAASFGLDRLGTTLGVDSADNARPHLLVFSAQHPEALRRSIENYKSYLSANPNALSDVSYSLGTRRETLTHRAFCIASGLGAYEVSQIEKPGEGGPPNLVFVFTGQGAQWALMGRELIEKEPIFRERIQVLDDFLSRLPDPPHWRLQDEILRLEQKSRLSDAEFSQPCCTAIQVALVDLLGKWNVKPAAVVGHSSGEIAAAYACGSITATEAILIAYHRGKVVRGVRKTHHGGMAVVGLGREQAAQYLLPGVTIGCENSPESVTLSGDADTLEGIMGHIRNEHPGVLVRSLRVDCAYHSHHMKAVEAEYQSLLGEAIRANSTEVPFYSSVTGEIVTSYRVLSASYWSQNLVLPVLFSSAVSAIVTSSSTPPIFLEIGPHPVLAGPIRQILRSSGKESDYVPTLTRNGDGMLDLLRAAGRLWVSGVGVDFSSVNPPGKILTDLPTYPWHYESRYWAESRLSKEWRLRKFPHHDILGSRVIESTDIEPSWRNMLRLDNVPWIRDHEIAREILFPGAAYVAMAGEAIRQLTGSSDFSVRCVNFTAALVLHQEEAVEVITNLRPARLTATLNSSWFDFTVSSLNGATWVKHCDGQARAGSEFQLPVPSMEPLPRRVPSSTWYRVMRRFGLNYGPRFRGLSDISAHVSERKAIATVSDNLEEGETPYQLHPTSLDCTFQLLTAAAFNGLARSFSKLPVPTYIEELYLRPPKGGILVQAEVDITARGTLSGDLVGVSEGETAVSVRGLRLSPLGDDDEAMSNDPHAAAELEWKSHLNFVNAAQLVRPLKDRTKSHLLLNRLALTCMIETRARTRDLEAAEPYLEKFRKWLDYQEERASRWQYPNVPDCASIAGMGSLERTHLIQDLLERSVGTEAAAAATAVHRIFASCSEIFAGSAKPLELLLEGNILTELYGFANNSDYSEFIDLAAHHKPNLKILEVGAGTGGTTNAILPHLKSAYGERMYSSYTYTDISAGFFSAARERFRAFPAMEYATLDISKDPIEQGFEAESFDLIIASNGVLPGWWLGDHDGRSTEPYVNAERWNEELKNAGFEGADAVVYDGHLNHDIIAMPARNNPRPKRLTILCSGIGASSVGEISSRLRKKGYELDFCTMDQTPVSGQDIVSLFDLEQPFLHSVSAAQFDAFRGFIARTRDSGILWVTGASQIACRDPRYSLILGMARTIRLEHRIDFATLELEDFNTDGWDAVADVLHDFESRIHDSDSSPDLEYAYSAGKVQISRYHWLSMLEALSDTGHQFHPRKLGIRKPGYLQSLNWEQIQPVPLVGDEVEIEMRAVGLNFKDVLLSLGAIEGRRREGRGLGLEGAGIIRRVGPEATNLKVGDKVVCLCSGSFQTTLAVTEKFCSRMTDGLSFVEAATMPCVYKAVIYGLIDLARLQNGQSVLIHSACGGVGMAAIQISRMIGAEIFCTVGNAEKVDYLMKNFDVPRNRIFHSRDTSFLRDVMLETNGRGVDVVLNSLSGELLHASWKCVAEYGVMIELGKRDLIGQGELRMAPFEQNRTFTGLDILFLCADRPLLASSLGNRMMEFFKLGHIKPISPVKEFEATQVEEAFKYMQKGQHIGKIVVTLPENPEDLGAVTGRRDLVLRPDVAYLSVGGLGGLGRSTASWLVEKGARHIVFFSRSAGSLAKDDPYIKELEAQGCTVQAFSGSVSNLSDVQKMIGSVGKPIAGVLQASMVLRDNHITEMAFDQWQATILPKVQGTWNLHEALQAQKEPLDFFFLFSSISGLGGQLRQSNYASANTFLAAFVQYRHSLGLPASVLDIGVIGDVGYLSQNDNVLAALRATSAYVLHEQDFLDSLELMIARSLPQSIPAASSPLPSRRYVNSSQVAIGLRSMLPLSSPSNRTPWRNDRRMSAYRNTESQDSTIGLAINDNFEQFLRDASTNLGLLESQESTALLAEEIGKTLSGFMMGSEGSTLDLMNPLITLGVDSLISIELRNWFKQKLDCEFTMLEIIGSENVTHLGRQARAKLLEKFKARA